MDQVRCIPSYNRSKSLDNRSKSLDNRNILGGNHQENLDKFKKNAQQLGNALIMSNNLLNEVLKNRESLDNFWINRKKLIMKTLRDDDLNLCDNNLEESNGSVIRNMFHSDGGGGGDSVKYLINETDIRNKKADLSSSEFERKDSFQINDERAINKEIQTDESIERKQNQSKSNTITKWQNVKYFFNDLWNGSTRVSRVLGVTLTASFKIALVCAVCGLLVAPIIFLVVGTICAIWLLKRQTIPSVLELSNRDFNARGEKTIYSDFILVTDDINRTFQVFVLYDDKKVGRHYAPLGVKGTIEEYDIGRINDLKHKLFQIKIELFYNKRVLNENNETLELTQLINNLRTYKPIRDAPEENL